MKKQKNDEKIMQRRVVKLYFDNEDMDFNLMWVLGEASAGGAELGECMHVASHIKDGDPKSWVMEWMRAGERLEERALAASQARHTVTARQAYLRAFCYYHISSLFARPQEEQLAKSWHRGISCFQKAAALFDPPIQQIEVPFKPFPLHGYFMPAHGRAKKAPTLIHITGGEGWAESAYFWVGAGLARGYNILTVDLPVHVGSHMRYAEFPFVDHVDLIDEPVNAVIDYAAQHPAVDPERLALIGFSIGGFFAGRGAMNRSKEHIKAFIANSPIHDVYALSTAEFPPTLLKAPAFVTNLVGKIIMRQNTTDAVTAERAAWMFGVGSLSELVERSRPLILEAEKIHCPTLCLASAGEARAFLKQANEFYDALTVPKTLHIFTAEEGSDAHCQVNNLALMQEVVFDWLDETLNN